MGRKKLTPVKQPNDVSCGPASNKMALEILGIRKSMKTLIEMCKTNSNGTTVANMISAIISLGVSVLEVKNTSLSHLQSALKHRPNHLRAVLVTFLSEEYEDGTLKPDSGHWAVVSSFSASKSRIVLINSYTAKKKSYDWQDFRERWRDYDYKLIRSGKTTKRIKKWHRKLMLVIARNPKDLPRFTIGTAILHTPDN